MVEGKIEPPTDSSVSKAKVAQSNRKFRIHVLPEVANDVEKYCELYVWFAFGPSYPASAPIVTLEKVKGLSDNQLKELGKKIETLVKIVLNVPIF